MRSPLAKNLVFIDGYMRSGKTLVATLASSLENVEMWQALEAVENIPVFYGLGKIAADAAAQMIQIEVDTHLYQSIIGRRVNFRKADDSSIWKYKDPEVYVRRAESPNEREALSALDGDRLISVVFTHDILCNPEPAVMAYPDLKIIFMQRNPIDIAHSWMRKDWPSRIGTDATATAPSVATPNGSAPWYAAEWAEEYDRLPKGDRIARCLFWLQARTRQKRKLLGDDATRVLDIFFEKIVTSPGPEIERMCAFLDTEPSEYTPNFLERERCPRILDSKDVGRKLADLREISSASGSALFEQLLDEYHVPV